MELSVATIGEGRLFMVKSDNRSPVPSSMVPINEQDAWCEAIEAGPNTVKVIAALTPTMGTSHLTRSTKRLYMHVGMQLA